MDMTLSLMSKSQNAHDIRDQHAQLSKLLDCVEANEHLPLSSGLAQELMDRLFDLVVKDIKIHLPHYRIGFVILK